MLDTDYVNYAVVYGCDSYWDLFHVQWASILSRFKMLQQIYVDAAYDVLKEYGYEGEIDLQKTDSDCGYMVGATSTEMILDLMNSSPDWDKYVPSSNGTSFASLFYGTNSTLVPTDPLLTSVEFEGTVIPTNLKDQIA